MRTAIIIITLLIDVTLVIIVLLCLPKVKKYGYKASLSKTQKNALEMHHKVWKLKKIIRYCPRLAIIVTVTINFLLHILKG